VIQLKARWSGLPYRGGTAGTEKACRSAAEKERQAMVFLHRILGSLLWLLGGFLLGIFFDARMIDKDR
jgi:hypothetical protein